MALGYYEIKRAKDGQFHFNLKAGNHEVILSSELYTTKAACENGIHSVQQNCEDASLYEKREAKNGSSYFVLKAKNHQEIGRSELYETMAGCENGMESVKKNGVSTEVKDKTLSKKGRPTCGICGEEMPKGEEMFNYHGHSGGCPKPPLDFTEETEEAIEVVEVPADTLEAMAENINTIATHVNHALSSGLKRETIVLLIHEKTKIPKGQIKKVLEAFENLDDYVDME